MAAALNAGADAIYFGVQGLNMRSRSSANFNLGDLREIAAMCAERGVKSYLTVNTVLYDDDLPRMREIIDAAKQANISAIIASDIAAISYASSIGQPVHISTQVNITNIEAVEFYAQWADVMVLARELNLEQVAAISAEIKRRNICGPSGKLVGLEMFCHGALCMAVSGKCYMSLHQMNSSANRGACTQICRRSYTLTDNETGQQIEVDNQYLMSPKDLKTLTFLDRMVQAGVTVFKIEGRARGPEYVTEVVRAYNSALCAIADGTFGPAMLEPLEQRLKMVFNRGFWQGYYLGNTPGEWSAKYGSSATRVKVYAARAIRYFSKLGVAEFKLEAGELNKGEEILIIGPTTGSIQLTLDEMRVDLNPVDKVTKGEHFSIAVPSKIRPSDRLYIWRETGIK